MTLPGVPQAPQTLTRALIQWKGELLLRGAVAPQTYVGLEIFDPWYDATPGSVRGTRYMCTFEFGIRCLCRTADVLPQPASMLTLVAWLPCCRDATSFTFLGDCDGTPNHLNLGLECPHRGKRLFECQFGAGVFLSPEVTPMPTSGSYAIL